MESIVISGTGLFTPPETISNQELVDSYNQYVREFNHEHQQAIAAGTCEELKESSVEFIEKASGIKKRHVLNKAGILDTKWMQPLISDRSDESLSVQAEIAVAAARGALERAHKKPQEVDGVIVACSNMQRAYPAMAIEIQNALGIAGFGFDLNVACSSAAFGLQVAVDTVRSGHADCVLMLNPEICTAHLDFRDRNSHFIFGDVSTAVVIERAKSCHSSTAFEVLGTQLRTQFSNSIRNNFGFMNRTDPKLAHGPERLFMQEGKKVFRDVVPMVVELIQAHLQAHHIEALQLKRLWLHQANSNMNRLIATKILGHEPNEQEAPTILNEYANTSSAGSIIAFHQFHADLKSGELGLLCAFGAGYSIGSAILRKI